ncbi:sulfite exporter TauE/SafE family protein [Neobacillus mesonae]|uniref:sulfite exporter TauE/SafE family protein n=1 Tax=Neobacillus mesonae TaxID=1193713 RepID=UPI00203CA0BB|nr:sulfite exporter TauE/SafE family protein [Neobacillus mesonae]MCM3568444.1 sulfite exporter TauE/SafE family protein [Neobacillus mesonae]
MDISSGLLILLIGALAAGYGTIVGAGGGFLFVPALLIIFHMDPAIAAGSGLVIVLINSFSGVFGYAKQKKIHYRTGIMLAIGALPGSLLGVWLLQLYSSSSFYFIFASLLVALGIFLFVKNKPAVLMKKKGLQARSVDGAVVPEIGEADQETASITKGTAQEAAAIENTNLQGKWLIPLGLFMGILSSYLGIGGGWLLVPILIYGFKVPTHYATATSIFSLCLYTTVGVASQMYYGNIDWITVLWGGIGVIIGSQLGVFLSQKIPGKIIIQMLSVLLVVIGFRMFFQ